MDPVKRGPHRLGRFLRAQSFAIQLDLSRSIGVRQFAIESNESSLRRLIDNTVATFLPPQLPIVDPFVTCTNALVEFRRSSGYGGGFQLSAQVTTVLSQPVAFILGFSSNKDGFWSCIFGALNFETESFATSRSNSGIFYTLSGSAWVGQQYERAKQQGVTFRIHSTVNLQGSPRTLLQEWAQKFDRPLGRLMSLLDLDETGLDNPVMESITNHSYSVPENEEGLSFSTRLLFE